MENTKNAMNFHAYPVAKTAKKLKKNIEIDKQSKTQLGHSKKCARGPIFSNFGPQLGASWGPKTEQKFRKICFKMVPKSRKKDKISYGNRYR